MIVFGALLSLAMTAYYRAASVTEEYRHGAYFLELLERCLEADMQIDRRVQLVLILEALLDALAQKSPRPSPTVG